MNIKELIQKRIDIHSESQNDKSMSDDYKFINEMVIKELMHIQKIMKLEEDIDVSAKEFENIKEQLNN